MQNYSLNAVWALILVFQVFSSSGQHKVDEIYQNENIGRTLGIVRLYPQSNRADAQMEPPIISLEQRTPLFLQFDLLDEEYRNLQARIIHCDADWTQSILNDIDFLREYNSFEILDFDYSVNTQTMYVNYWFRIPRVKVSGNYVIQVYQNNNKRDILFSRRFIVYENRVNIRPEVKVSTLTRKRRTHHQVDFSLFYSGLGRVISPMSEFKVVVRQNDRWDNAITDLKPTNLNQSEARVDYKAFNGVNNFGAGNEFRFFDIRTFTFRGQFISKINRQANPIQAFVSLGESKAGRVYSETRDRNGNYFVATAEAGAGILESNYLNVIFRLKAEPLMEPVYVLGEFNNWIKDGKSQMQYDPNTKSYFRAILLKQGVYDYQYWVDGEDPLIFENSFFDANNKYDIIVYRRSLNDLTDKIVGYSSFYARF